MSNFKFSKLFLPLLFAPVVLLSGCFPSGEQSLPSDPEEIMSQIESITSEYSHIEIDSNVEPVNEVQEVPLLNVTMREWDEDILKAAFLDGREISDSWDGPSDMFPGDKFYGYDTEKGEGKECFHLRIETGSLLMEIRRDFDRYGFGTIFYGSDDTWYGDFFTDEELSAVSKDDAIKQCEELLDKLDIKDYSVDKIYSLTADKADEVFRRYREDCGFEGYGYDKWTAEQESYIITFTLEYEGLPLAERSPTNLYEHGIGAPFVGSQARFLVGKDGILAMRADNIFSSEYETGEAVAINCSAENALLMATENFKNIVVIDSVFTIQDCTLVYAPVEVTGVKQAVLSPVWKITASYDAPGLVMPGIMNYFIDATTGKQIMW